MQMRSSDLNCVESKQNLPTMHAILSLIINSYKKDSYKKETVYILRNNEADFPGEN